MLQLLAGEQFSKPNLEVHRTGVWTRLSVLKLEIFSAF
jgi:hypothetical protein